MKLVCISDTHSQHRKLAVPDGDVLVYAGDITHRGEMSITQDFNVWLGELPHKYKIVIAGNHDFNFENEPTEAEALITNAHYLNDSGIEIDGVKFWGSPVQPWFHNWAFNRGRGDEIKEHWDLIPEGTDVLITHGPPFGVLDKPFGRSPSVGCADLTDAVKRIKPTLHVFGHIHGDYGQQADEHTTFVNASVVNEAYQLTNKPVEFRLEALCA